MKSGNYTFITVKLDMMQALKAGGPFNPNAVIKIAEEWSRSVDNCAKKLCAAWCRSHADTAQIITAYDMADSLILEQIHGLRSGFEKLFPVFNKNAISFGIGRGEIVWDSNIALGQAVEIATRGIMRRADEVGPGSVDPVPEPPAPC
jgi:hypothetical protein